MNHPATMFRKKAVVEAGGYNNFAGLEDYHLWARMLMNGAKMANIGEVLYYHRWDKELLRRRSGKARTAQQIRLQREFLKSGFINSRQFLINVIVRTAGTLLPVGLMRRVRIALGI